MYDVNGVINKENILERISQQEIFIKYLGIEPKLNKEFQNPFRGDDHAGCRFYISDKTGMLKFKDFARGWNWDCFNVVMVKYQCNFGEALIIIAEDFNFKKRTISDESLKEREIAAIAKLNNFIPKIEIKERYWHKLDVEYWMQFGITTDILKFYNVFPVKKAWLNNDITYIENDDDPCYAYYLGKKSFKLYFPKRKKSDPRPRFMHNNSNAIQGHFQLEVTGDILVITKSLKDVMCMSQFGINSIALMGETIPLTQKAFEYYQKRYNKIATLLDRDKAGILMTNKLHKMYNTTKLIFTKEDEKDFADNLVKYGHQYMLDYIEETKNQLGWL